MKDLIIALSLSMCFLTSQYALADTYCGALHTNCNDWCGSEGVEKCDSDGACVCGGG